MTVATKSPFVVVTSTGITCQPLTNGQFVSNNGALSPRLGRRIASGEVTVTTPHQAGGAYLAREDGGVYAAIKTSAKLRDIYTQIDKDPRGTPEQKKEVIAAIKAFYAPVNDNKVTPATK